MRKFFRGFRSWGGGIVVIGLLARIFALNTAGLAFGMPIALVESCGALMVRPEIMAMPLVFWCKLAKCR